MKGLILEAIVLVYVALCLALGIAIPVHVSMNSRAGVLSGNAPFANSLFWLLGFATSIVLSAGGIAKEGFGRISAVPPPLWLGGAIGAGISLSVSIIIPKLGVGNATFLLILGQMLASAAMSNHGILGSPRDPLTLQKLAGLLVMGLGLALFVFSGRPPRS